MQILKFDMLRIEKRKGGEGLAKADEVGMGDVARFCSQRSRKGLRIGADEEVGALDLLGKIFRLCKSGAFLGGSLCGTGPFEMKIGASAGRKEEGERAHVCRQEGQRGGEGLNGQLRTECKPFGNSHAQARACVGAGSNANSDDVKRLEAQVVPC